MLTIKAIKPINKNMVSHLDKYLVGYRVGENTYQVVEGHHGVDRAEWARGVLQSHDRDKAGFKDREYAILNREDCIDASSGEPLGERWGRSALDGTPY